MCSHLSLTLLMLKPFFCESSDIILLIANNNIIGNTTINQSYNLYQKVWFLGEQYVYTCMTVLMLL